MKKHLCYFCDYSCIEIGTLRKHELTHTQEMRFKCNFCEFSAISNRSIINHEKFHSTMQPYQCEHYDREFKSSHGLKYHIKKKHELHGSFQCKICSKTFVESSLLRTHEARHNKVKSFSCDNCSYSCKTRGELIRGGI